MSRAGNQGIQPSEQKAIRVVQNAAGLEALFKMKSQEISDAMPRSTGMTMQRFTKLALQAAINQSKLFQCDVASFALACLKAASLGLEIDSMLGTAYIVPYWNSKMNCYNAQLQIGYRGLCQLFQRANAGGVARSKCVYEGDTFDYNYGHPKSLRHVPCGEDDPKKITHAYAVYELPGGGWDFEVMPRVAIEKIRQRSKAKDNGPWVTDWPEMARKTPLRKLLKTAPLSPEYLRAVVEDEVDDIVDVTATTRVIDEASRRQQEKDIQDAADAAEKAKGESEKPTQPAQDAPPPEKTTDKASNDAQTQHGPQDEASGASKTVSKTKKEAKPEPATPTTTPADAQEASGPAQTGEPSPEEAAAIKWVEANSANLRSAILNFRPRWNAVLDKKMAELGVNSLQNAEPAQLEQIAIHVKMLELKASKK